MLRTGQAFKRLFLSFTLIFLIPTAMGMLFYLYAYRAAVRQADVYNQSLLNTVKTVGDQEMRGFENELLALAQNDSVQALASETAQPGTEAAYDQYALYNELSVIRTSLNRSGNVCRDVFAYFQNSDRIVSSMGAMSLDLYCRLYSGGQAEQRAELRAALGDARVFALRSMEQSWDGGSMALLTMPALGAGYSGSAASVGIWLDMEAFEGRIDSADQQSGLIWMMVGEDGKNINRPGQDLGIAYGQLAREQKTSWNGAGYFTRAAKSEVGSWSYVVLMPESMISGQAGAIRNVFLLGMAVCVVLGCLAAAYMLRLNYSPLKRITELLRAQTGGQGYSGNEYQYLESGVRRLFREQGDFRRAIEENRQALRQYYLTALLEKPYEAEEETREQAAFSETLRSGRNVVLLIAVKKEKRREAAAQDSVARMLLCGAFEEELGKNNVCEAVELGETVALILNLQEGTPELQAELTGGVEELLRMSREQLGIDAAAFLGGVHEGLAGIHQSYREAREAETFSGMLDADFIRYEEIRNTATQRYAYAQEQEQRILAALSARNAELANACIGRVLEANFVENHLPSELRTCLIYDLAATIMKAGEANGPENTPAAEEKDKVLRELSASLPLEELRACFARMVQSVCGAAEPQEKHQNRQLCEEVYAYICASYGDPDLNISTLGQHFHLTPAYLSAIYRGEMGESLLKVIARVRIREAQRMLGEGVSVVEAGARAGFRDSSTFIRAFKKETGTTPGQFRQGH